MIEQEKVSDLAGLDSIAQWLVKEFKSKVVLLNGEMGAGKTTLVKAICKSLSVNDEVSSPTYSLVNEYHSQSGEVIYHFDLYRLENEDEALDFGIEDYLYSGNLCLIEWPEKIVNLLPDDSCQVFIKTQGNLRTFELKNN